MVGRRKTKHLALVIFYDEFNSYEFLTEVIRQVLGYEYSQAANCANVIFTKGEYVCKTFKMSELKKAEKILSVIKEQEVPATLFPM
jgi:ATP-dependent Clp protease adapter protein ClpS